MPEEWDAVRAGAVAPRGRWARLDVLERTGSTNADLAAAARLGPERTPDRTVLVAHHQDAGRGRRDRRWDARPGEGLTLSVLLRPGGVPAERFGWAPLLAGLALVAVADEAAVPAGLKWPNDLLVGDPPAKAAGILAELGDGGPGASGPALVVGIGLNVATPREALPAGGTSLRAEGDRRGPPEVLSALLAALADLDAAWRRAAGDVAAAGLWQRYRRRCTTLGQRVRVELPGGRVETGVARDVDEHGRLVVAPEDPARPACSVAAGDVVHLRPVSRPDGAGPGP